MLDLLLTLLTGQVGGNLRRLARAAVFAVMAMAFALIALAAGAVALFLALEADFGPITAALILAAVAAALAGLASIPLWTSRKPPPPSAVASLAELALAVGLGFLSRRGRKDDAPKGGAP